MEILYQSFPFLLPMVKYNDKEYSANVQCLLGLGKSSRSKIKKMPKNKHKNKNKKRKKSDKKKKSSPSSKLKTSPRLQRVVPHIVKDREGFVYIDYPFE